MSTDDPSVTHDADKDSPLPVEDLKKEVDPKAAEKVKGGATPGTIEVTDYGFGVARST